MPRAACPRKSWRAPPFFDDFDGFTQPQYALLDAFLQAESRTVALCCDGLADAEDGLGLFSPVAHGRALLRAARRLGVRVEKPKLCRKTCAMPARRGWLP